MELPVSFVDYTRSLLGDAEYGRLSEALNDEQPVSIRLNEAKYPVASSPLSCDGSCRVPWTSAGFYLSRRPTFTFDPLFHAGCYYVQEASSMFVEQALRQYVGTDPVVALDLCAAPGGKSTHVRSLLPEGSLLVANEVIRNRSQILAENLTKWGHPDVVVTNNDPADFSSLTAFFDVILTDVPCSGEGMFRKDPVAVSEWSPENVDVCWQRQRRILSDCWYTVRARTIQKKMKRISAGCVILSVRRSFRWISLPIGTSPETCLPERTSPSIASCLIARGVKVFSLLCFASRNNFSAKRKKRALSVGRLVRWFLQPERKNPLLSFLKNS